MHREFFLCSATWWTSRWSPVAHHRPAAERIVFLSKAVYKRIDTKITKRQLRQDAYHECLKRAQRDKVAAAVESGSRRALLMQQV